MRQLSFTQIGLTGLLFFILLTGCDCGKPTEPEPIVKEYPIYFYNRTGDQLLFKYQPDTQTMDSAIIQWDPDKISLSADGKLLYLVVQTSIVVIDALDYSFVRELPYITFGAVAVSPDNKLIAITGDTLRIIRTSDYSEIYSDSSVNTFRGIFSQDNSTFYCGFNDSSNAGAVYKLELTSPNFIKTTKSFEGRSFRSIKPTHDEKKWILYGGLNFNIYDIALDSFIFHDHLIGGWGSTALSADGKKVIYTDPGSQGNMNYIPPYIKIFDIQTNTIEAVIDSFLLFSDSLTWMTNPSDVVVTADNKYLGVIGGTAVLNVFILFDLQTLEMIDRINYKSNQYTLTPMSAQNSL